MFIEPSTGALIEPLGSLRLEAAQIRMRIAARAARFRARGLAPRDRVFIHYGNTAAFFIDLMALWQVGACAIPIDARLTAFEVETLARAARPRFSLIDAGMDNTLLGRLTAAGITAIGAEETEEAAPVPPALRLDDPALILFTSGTTGDPKGVVHTHRSLRARWMSLKDALGTASYARTLCLLPTHFGHGLICNALFPWLCGADLFILPPFRADIITGLGTLIDVHEITAMSSVPTVWTLALRMAKPPAKGTLKRVHCGSAPLSKAQWLQIQSWTGTAEVLNTYGITETASWVAGTPPGAVTPEEGLVGLPWGAAIKIVKPGAEDAGEALCAPGEAGMIWLNTPALMEGYFEREDLNAKVIRAGWFMTGDIGMLDERGLLYLRGRERDEINKGGMKVYPSDVDGVALQAPGVSDACAFAVSDPLYGQDVGLALVLTEAGDGALARVKAFMAERLAKHQMPARWHVLTEIPRTSRGKINRDQVAAACGAGTTHA
jgi:acyl-CoA synthetase (AMP-forming)/AMP-acid ligase II